MLHFRLLSGSHCRPSIKEVSRGRWQKKHTALGIQAAIAVHIEGIVSLSFGVEVLRPAWSEEERLADSRL